MDKRNFIEGLAQEAEDAASKGDMNEVYRITRKLSWKQNISHHQVHSKDRKVLTAEDEQLKRWREYFKELLNRPLPAIAPNIAANSLLNIKTETPPKREIRKALQHLKKWQSPGPGRHSPRSTKNGHKVNCGFPTQAVWEDLEYRTNAWRLEMWPSGEIT